MSVSMNGKRVLVTGANAGIGFITARDLARLGARVVMLVRDRQRGEAARQRIAEETGAEDIELLLADFTSLEQVQSAAEGIARRHDRLDVLIANAGAIYPERRITVDGNEMTFQVNHLAHFALCTALQPLLAASAPSRVITVSSDAHFATWRGIRFTDPTFARGWSPFRAYAHSKLANIMFCYEHARRVAASDVTSTVVHPGLVNSGFGAEGYGPYGRLIGTLAPLIAKTPEQGADSVLWLAAQELSLLSSGGYYFKRRPHRSSPASNDRAAQRRLWAMSVELTELDIGA